MKKNMLKKYMSTKRIILLIYCYLATLICINAQGIKEQAEKKKQQQQYEREQRENELKEQARIKKSQLNINDLLQLLQSKDLDYVDRFLTDKGWKLHSTNIKKTDEYDNEVTTDYKQVTWSYEKNSYNELAKGWFYFYLYPNFDNAIAYTFANEDQLDRLKSELTTNGYKRIYPTDAIERGLESVYRNGLYEVNFKKQLKKQYEDGADIGYNFFIYNYKQVEERKAEAERLAREAAERDEKYQNSIQLAESAYYQKQYVRAKQFYIEALTIKPENQDMFTDKLAEIDINILCEEAENLYKAHQYDKAKIKYANALTVKPNKQTDFIQRKIKEIADFQIFLKERTYKQYDYKMLEESDYEAKDSYIKTELQKALLANSKTLTLTTINIICEVDTFGISTTNFNTSVQNEKINVIINNICKNLRLKQVFWNKYTVLSKAEFSYTIDYNHAVISVKKNPDGISSSNKDFNIYRSDINSELSSSAPYGKYTFEMNKTNINGQAFDNNKLIKMSGSGGPSNAFLSLLVPGLGDHNVSFGEKSGVKTALWTYGLIGAGIGLKLYSNSEYKKYHAATEQSAIDEHYQAANYSNQAFYGCLITGGIVWISDIIWVWSKGAKNAKAAKSYKNSHLGAFYTPDLNATGLSYTINY